MRLRGVNHVEFSVIDYEQSIKFYDKMFGWLGYKSFWTMDIDYRSTYYVAGIFPFIHSYIGIQPAKDRTQIDHTQHLTGIHHIALWARNKREIDTFYREFLLKENITVTDNPSEYQYYAPGYYAVCFLDPSGIRWELAYIPRIPRPGDLFKFLKAIKEIRRAHPEWKRSPLKEAWRSLPGKENN